MRPMDEETKGSSRCDASDEKWCPPELNARFASPPKAVG